ncbi:MAG: ABC transporter permease, partial [Deltaproteobacteria bacterium]|nr:ABC transporter permease [Deltaproteobacteria bacterium]
MRHLLRNITLRRLFEHPFRTALTILGISLGVAAFISVRIILDTMSDSFSSMIDTVSGRVQLQITGGELGVDEDIYRQLTEQDAQGRLPVPGLRTALPTIQAITRYG